MKLCFNDGTSFCHCRLRKQVKFPSEKSGKLLSSEDKQLATVISIILGSVPQYMFE